MSGNTCFQPRAAEARTPRFLTERQRARRQLRALAGCDSHAAQVAATALPEALFAIT